MRVHELAKELNISSKQLVDELNKAGFEAKSHMSSLDDAAVSAARGKFAKTAVPAQPKKTVPAKEPAPAAAPAAPPSPARPTVKHETDAQPLQPPQEKKPEEKPEIKEHPAGPPDDKVIRFKGPIIVRELAESIGIKPNRLVAELMGMNIFATINQRLELPIARRAAEKHGFTVEHIKRTAEHPAIHKKELDEEPDRPEDLLPRPPIVTFLGHVDHGKTSLLDRIRNSSVVKTEHGGITQHIGAYSVDIAGRSITFLDTPGHEAFTAMRARGANLTDIAVIVIAADDGIMPQTREAIMHAKASEVSIMIAINKTDLPAANIDRVKKQLQAENLAPEDWGGNVICAPVSAITGNGIDHLLEMILLQADVLELKANPSRRGTGFVIESRLEPGMGPVATLLVAGGTVKIGDPILCGCYWGRIKALINDRGIKVKSAGPSSAIQCLGLSGVPDAGAEFRVTPDDKIARDIAEELAQKSKAEQISAPKRVSLLDLFDHLKEAEKKELRIVLKADTQGSVEAITNSLENIKSAKVSLNIILSAIGNITTNDIMLASASDAVILGFHVAKEPGAEATSRHEGVEIRLHHIIYDLVEEVEKAMLGLLSPVYSEKITGHALVKQVFPIGKSSSVAGCYVSDGKFTSKSKVRIRRDNEVLFQGVVESLKHFQNHVSDIKEGQECGLRIGGFRDFKTGDFLEFFELSEVKQTL